MSDLLLAILSGPYWQHGFSLRRAAVGLLSAFGALWLVVEIVSFFWPDASAALRQFRWVFVLGGLATALWVSRPRHSVTCQLSGRDVTISIRIGNLFKMSGALIVGSNITFDTTSRDELISERSVQGQFTRQFYDSEAHLDADLDSALTGLEFQALPDRPMGKKKAYAIGTVARVRAKSRTAYFVAIASLNDHGVAQGTFGDLKDALPRLWEYVTTRGDFQALAMPVIGSGFSRIPQTREEIIREIINSFVAACAAQRPSESLTIVIPYRDFYDHRVDLESLERFTQHVCRYHMQSGNAIGVGRPIA